MILEFFRRRSEQQRQRLAAAQIYVGLATLARTPELYLHMGVPDTVDGRLEALMLFAGLGVDRLTREKTDPTLGRDFARLVSEAFFDDMDRTFREMGIKDIGVPRKVRTVSKGFYGRMKSYVEALHSDDPGALGAALQRNFFSEGAPISAEFAELAPYIRSFYAQLMATELPTLMAEPPHLPIFITLETESAHKDHDHVAHR